MSEEDKHRMIFEEAIRFETDGREFFLNAAEKSRNPFTKTVFQMIAEEERDHIKKIQQFFKSYSVSEKEEIPLGMKEENLLQNVFRQAIDRLAAGIDPALVIAHKFHGPILIGNLKSSFHASL